MEEFLGTKERKAPIPLLRCRVERCRGVVSASQTAHVVGNGDQRIGHRLVFLVRHAVVQVEISGSRNLDWEHFSENSLDRDGHVHVDFVARETAVLESLEVHDQNLKKEHSNFIFEKF